ncbi:UNVERIFIED_CONTAM: hypothetical protein Sradi_4300200 [Sesamum radiatum]|uniref:Uncharacterized protein n=1 Tax=Sesamum radiatum TaxID=300843 RepID=A0AAW2NLS0_SESRA
MFSKHLQDERKGATTSPSTRSSRGTPSSSDQRGKRAAVVLLRSSSKKPRPSSSDFPPATLLATLLPTSSPLPRDLGTGPSKSPSFPTGGVYNHLTLSLEKDGAPGRAVDILKGALSSEDRRFMSSLPTKDLDLMLTLVDCAEGRDLVALLGGPSQGEVSTKKLEDRVERLLGEVTKMNDSMKEPVGRYQQAEKEVKDCSER